MNFQQGLQMGQLGESLIAGWMRKKGWTVLPVYDVEIDTGKGPRLFAPDDEEVIATDIFTFKGSSAYWVEAKHKSVFTWHRKSQNWQTGIDLKHYKHYLRVAQISKWPIWLLFLHRDSCHPKRPHEPWPCPTGLFAGELLYLSQSYDHTHGNWGRSGMIYWNHQALQQIATIEEVLGVSNGVAPVI